MQRSNAAKAIRRDTCKAWDAVRDVVASGEIFRDHPDAPLLEDGPTESLASPRHVDGSICSMHSTHSAAEGRDHMAHAGSSFFARNFNVGTGAGFRSTLDDIPLVKPRGMFWSPSTDARAIWNLLTGSYMNVLLVLCPLGVLASYRDWGATTVFLLNFCGIIPLALILGDVTEDLAMRCGDVVGGLVNATFGNVVELILSIVALSKGRKDPSLNNVAGMSNLGSILSNLLLVLGCCFFFGGLNNKVQKFNALANSVCNSLLFLAVVALSLPLAAAYLPDVQFSNDDMLFFSRFIAIALIAVYIAYLYFQLVSHHDLFAAEDEGGDDADAEGPALTVTAEIGMLAGVSLVVALASELITGSIEEMAETSGLTTNFLSIVLLPIAGNAVEHITAVMVAIRNKMDLALGIAIGSSIQIAIFVLPACVLSAWAMHNPFTLRLNGLGTIALVVAVVHANFITAGGKSHYLMGLQLICTYLLISCAFLFTD